MDTDSVLAKTAKGVEEIEQRKHKLDAKLRSILIMVNGKQTAGELAQKLAQLGDLPAMLGQLVEQGFVTTGAAAAPLPGRAPAPAEARAAAARAGVPIGQARAELARAITTLLGPGGDDIAMSIEAAKTVEALRAYLESRRAILDQVLGKSRASAFWGKVAELLG